ncbi:MAG: hypothetical protein E6I26_14685 [Chloroflexi bacterium]|nr:MAG: hypothetical protein E6I26_14685 [Chloroflexota bacterium]
MLRRPELGPRALRVAAGFGSAVLASGFFGRVAFDVGAFSFDSTASGRDLAHAGVISVESNSTWR